MTDRDAPPVDARDVRAAILAVLQTRTAVPRQTLVATVATACDAAPMVVGHTLDDMEREGQIYAANGCYKRTPSRRELVRDG